MREIVVETTSRKNDDSAIGVVMIAYGQGGVHIGQGEESGTAGEIGKRPRSSPQDAVNQLSKPPTSLNELEYCF